LTLVEFFNLYLSFHPGAITYSSLSLLKQVNHASNTQSIETGLDLCTPDEWLLKQPSKPLSLSQSGDRWHVAA
jgi:hypothetical protein